MHVYINLTTKEYPVYEGDIRIDHPNIPEDITGDAFPCPDGFAKVKWVEPPAYDEIEERLVQLTPKCVNGVWNVRWAVEDHTLEAKIRLNNQAWTPENNEIDMELAACDQSIKTAPEDQRPIWQSHKEALLAYINQYPRVGTRPILPPVLFMPELNNAGSAPDVIE